MRSLEEIEMTQLDECYLIMYTIKVKVNIKKEEQIRKQNMYVLIGLNPQGRRKYIGAYLDDTTNHRYWLDIFEQLKSKGIKDIIYLSVDDNVYLKKCIKVSYPTIEIVPSLLDITEEFYKYFSDKFSSKIRTELKQLYIQEDPLQYQNCYALFLEKYGHNSIFVSLIERYLKDIDKLYQYDQSIRVALFNTYSLKLIKNKIEKLNKIDQYYYETSDIMKMLLEQLNHVENYTSYTKKEWLNILESFYKIYSNRIARYL